MVLRQAREFRRWRHRIVGDLLQRWTLCLGLGGEPLVTLLGDRHADSLAFGQRHPRLGSLADREDVIQSGGEGVSCGILDVDDVEGSGMLFTVHDDADATQVTTSRDHANVAGLELDVIGDLARGDIDLDAVLGLDQGVRISDGTPVGGGEIGNPFGSNRDLLDNAELVSGFFRRDAMHLVSSFDVVDEPEVLSALLHRDDVHETGRVGVVGADSAVDFDQTLGEDLFNFGVVESVLETIPQEERQRQTFPELVGTGRGPGSVTSSQLVEHPVLGRRHALHVLTGTANHVEI